MGLTMAEIMVLVIFALLLILAKVVTSVQATPAVPPTLVDVVKSWAKAGISGNDFDDKARELVVSAELGAAVAEELRAVPAVPLSSQTTNPSKKELQERAKELIKTARSFEEAFGPNTMGLSAHDATNEFVATVKSTYAAARQKEGFGSALIWFQDLVNRARSAEGKGLTGTEHPPCSSTDGKPDFIFDAHLGSTTITLHDNELQEVAAKRADWPTSEIKFDTPVTKGTFLSMTNALFQWSDAKQCRFFVRIVDDTLAHEKAIYKIQLRTVGYHFYYYEPLAVSSGGVQ